MWTARQMIAWRPCGATDAGTLLAAPGAAPYALSVDILPGAPPQAGRARKALLLVATGAVLMSLAGCGSATSTQQIPNPPASELNATVSVLDRATPGHSPSDHTIIIIQLTRVTPTNGSSKDIIQGTETRTLACDGVTMEFNPLLNAGLAAYQDSYVATIAPQTAAYSCAYFWDNGAQQAAITIPALRAEAPQIQSPTSRAILSAPRPGDAGLSVSYSPQGAADARVTVTATDYNNRSATSGEVADAGSVTIAAASFPSVFSVGWGTISMTRTISDRALDTGGASSSFNSIQLKTYEQVDRISVFWV
jgi:hypothetical protein